MLANEFTETHLVIGTTSDTYDRPQLIMNSDEAKSTFQNS